MKILCFSKCHNDSDDCLRKLRVYTKQNETLIEELRDSRKVISEHSNTITELTCRFKQEKESLERELDNVRRQLEDCSANCKSSPSDESCFDEEEENKARSQDVTIKDIFTVTHNMEQKERKAARDEKGKRKYTKRQR
jgi:hypothetical protein